MSGRLPRSRKVEDNKEEGYRNGNNHASIYSVAGTPTGACSSVGGPRNGCDTNTQLSTEFDLEYGLWKALSALAPSG